MFRQISATGAGRPVDKDGVPAGPWTPEHLAIAISQIDANRSGIELRTVQLWFQDNDKGISRENIRWLARVFGCNDPEATSAWQAELSAAQARLVAGRRAGSRPHARHDATGPPGMTPSAMLEDDIGPSVATTRARALSRPKRRVGLARRSEEVFSHASPLDLPAAVFAGAVALGFLSFFFGIHSVAYMRADGAIKQVGFLWAPNWTLLFMVFMPLYFVTVAELLVFWKTDGRPRLATGGDRAESDAAWARKVEASTLTNWVVLVICLPFAGLFQWMVTSLLPLLRGDRGNFAMDWGVITLVRPEIISMPASILFTGVAYLYMSLCFYLFFVGLILLYTMADDYRDLIGTRRGAAAMFVPPSAGARLLCGTFRSAILGVLIAICMKLQSAYLTTDSANLLDWLIGDLISVFTAREVTAHAGNYATPTHYSSLLVVVATCAVFLHCALHLRSVWKRQGGNFLGQHCGLLNIMSLVLALLVAGYLLIGTVAGFSILLVIGLLPAVYGLFDPLFGMGKLAEREGTSHVS